MPKKYAGQNLLIGTSGFTLIELLISVVIIGLVMGGLHTIIASALTTHANVQRSQTLVTDARAAMQRMSMFVQETDQIAMPDDIDQETLVVADRLLDLYDNFTHGFNVDGDLNLDADNDADGRVNESGDANDITDWVTFDLDKGDADNWKLRVTLPDYSTADMTDSKTPIVLCERVTSFRVSRVYPSTDLVEIELALADGDKEVVLTNRVRAAHVE